MYVCRYSSANGDPAAMRELAEQLVRRARELSLDKQRDSPFAILAKENDIMWGGGMPDDTTVVVARVVTPIPGTAGTGQGHIHIYDRHRIHTSPYIHTCSRYIVYIHKFIRAYMYTYIQIYCHSRV